MHCTHDEAVSILRNAGDLIMLTVKYYRAATPFLKKEGTIFNPKGELLRLIYRFANLFFSSFRKDKSDEDGKNQSEKCDSFTNNTLTINKKWVDVTVGESIIYILLRRLAFAFLTA